MPLTLVLLAVLSSPPAAVWGEQGHRLVCEIAQRRLTPAATALVQSIRAGDPSPTDSFASSCLWADAVRNTTHTFTYYYHFINIPPHTAGVNLQRDCADPARYCAPWAIRHYATVLLDPDGSGLEKAEALKFLAHFVGDLHQPLHAGRPADLGGNRIRVDFFGQRETNGDSLNLHRVWDTSILERAGLVWPGSADVLDAEISPAQAAQWESPNVLRWTNESYRHAEAVAYRLPSGKRIRSTYFNRAKGVSRLQLKRAGVRLAYLLNQIAAGTLDPASMGLP
jgi:hypothetical protein